MPAASPRQGGFFRSEEDFPPLPSSTTTPTVVKPRSTKLTYAESTRTKPLVPISNLPPILDVPIKSPIVTQKDGVKAVIFQQEEVEASQQAFKYALVARFHGERPSVDTFERFVNSDWGLKKPAVVGLLNPRHIMIRLESEDDFTHAWTRENNYSSHHRFTLFKWSEGVLENKVMKRAAWIELLRLPVMYQLPSMLEQIANSIGRFLRLDERTRVGKHPISPRICVEIDFAAPLPTDVWVGYVTPAGEHIGFKQNITYDFTKSKCSSCKTFGHELQFCPQQHAKVPSFKRRNVQNVLDKQKEGSSFQRQKWIPLLKLPVERNGKGNTPSQNHSPQHEQFMSPTLDKDAHSATNTLEDNIQLEVAHVPNGQKMVSNLKPIIETVDHSSIIVHDLVNAITLINNKHHPAPQPKPFAPQPTSPHEPVCPNQLHSNGEPNDKDSTQFTVHIMPPTKQGITHTSGIDSPTITATNAQMEQKQIDFTLPISAHYPYEQKEMEPFAEKKTTEPPIQLVFSRRKVAKKKSSLDKRSTLDKDSPHCHTHPANNIHVEQFSNVALTKEPTFDEIGSKENLGQNMHELDSNRNELAIVPYTIKMLQDSSQEQAENSAAQEVTLLLEEKTKTFLDSVRTQRHIKLSSKAIQAESFGRIDPGIKWADVLDSEDEK